MIAHQDAVIKKFKEILIESGIRFESVYLFGSRAREQFEEHSDWDFFIVVVILYFGTGCFVSAGVAIH